VGGADESGADDSCFDGSHSLDSAK
jgi:hypothetical protein